MTTPVVRPSRSPAARREQPRPDDRSPRPSSPRSGPSGEWPSRGPHTGTAGPMGRTRPALGPPIRAGSEGPAPLVPRTPSHTRRRATGSIAPLPRAPLRGSAGRAGGRPPGRGDGRASRRIRGVLEQEHRADPRFLAERSDPLAEHPENAPTMLSGQEREPGAVARVLDDHLVDPGARARGMGFVSAGARGERGLPGQGRELVGDGPDRPSRVGRPPNRPDARPQSPRGFSLRALRKRGNPRRRATARG